MVSQVVMLGPIKGRAVFLGSLGYPKNHAPNFKGLFLASRPHIKVIEDAEIGAYKIIMNKNITLLEAETRKMFTQQ